MDKMFSSPSIDPEVLKDPPPPYVLPPDFLELGIKEDDLEILRDYDTVIILDDSGSMEPLWDQVSDTFLLTPNGSSVTPTDFCRRHVERCRYSRLLPPDTTQTVSKSVFSTGTTRGIAVLR